MVVFCNQYTFYRLWFMSRLDKNKRDIMNFVYNTLYKRKVERTTYFQVLEFIDNCFFYFQDNNVLLEYKKYLFYNCCCSFGMVRNKVLLKNDIMEFFDNKNQVRPINFNKDVIERI